MAAAVAAATCGFESVVHIPKGVTFTPGAASAITQTGLLSAKTVRLFVALITPGVIPKLHLQLAPVTINCDIYSSFLIETLNLFSEKIYRFVTLFSVNNIFDKKLKFFPIVSDL